MNPVAAKECADTLRLAKALHTKLLKSSRHSALSPSQRALLEAERMTICESWKRMRRVFGLDEQVTR